MKVVYCKHLPIKGFFAMNLFGVCIVRSEYKWIMERGDYYCKKTINHESIHTAQMKETLFIGFYILYFLLWLVNLVISPKTAYRNIAFEQEAYANDTNLNYLESRKHFAWVKYLFKRAA